MRTNAEGLWRASLEKGLNLVAGSVSVSTCGMLKGFLTGCDAKSGIELCSL